MEEKEKLYNKRSIKNLNDSTLKIKILIKSIVCLGKWIKLERGIHLWEN